jgi:ribosome-associated translation inhibitor RaiA
MNRCVVTLIALCLTCGCARTQTAVQDDARAQATAAQRRAENLIAGFDARIASMRASMNASSRRVSSETRDAVAALEEKKTSVLLRLEDVKISSADKIKDAAAALEQAVDDLEKSARTAADRLK